VFDAVRAERPNVMFTFQISTENDLGLPGIVAEQITSRAETAKFDLALVIGGQPGAMYATLSYRTALFDRETVERMARHFLHFVAEAVARPRDRVDDIPLMDEAEMTAALLLGTGAI
jgi:non-ribosomal peptide synthetase component F